MKIIDGENMILGRLATYVAKQSLLGQEIAVVNCEKIIVSGNKHQILEKHINRQAMGHPRWGPFFPKRADLFVKRTIRGMVPRKRIRGREALQKVKCYIGLPNQFKDAQMETLQSAHVKKIPNLKYITIREICKIIGGKWQQK